MSSHQMMLVGFSVALVTLSVVVAIVISFVALSLSHRFRHERRDSLLYKSLSAVVMGAATTMHYLGMAAVSFVDAAVVPDLSHAVSVSWIGAAWVLESRTGQGSTFHFTARFGLASPSKAGALDPEASWAKRRSGRDRAATASWSGRPPPPPAADPRATRDPTVDAAPG